MSSPPTRVDLDAIRRRVSLSGLIGRDVKLRRAGRAWKGLCPFHGEKTPSFTVDDARGTYHCFGCGAHGSVFDWVMHVERVDFAEAVKRLAEGGEIAAAPVAATANRDERSKSREIVESIDVAQWLWRTASPARGSIVERYLRSRGLSPSGVPDGLDALRFHPRAAATPWRVDASEGDAAVRAPAMLGLIVDADGGPMGVHATYLRSDGSGKARLPRTWDGHERPSRKMWGRLSGGAVWLAGEPTGARDVPLVAGEGIETVWAFVERLGKSCRAAAALSLDNLQGFPTLTNDGAIPWHAPLPDPQRPCFTIPDPGDVTLLIDADMKPIRRKVQPRRGARWEERELTGADRAHLCATLATQAWRRAGARRIEAVRPPIGMDFNDLAKAEAAA